MSRTNELRQRAEQGEREARIRLDLTQRLLAGSPPPQILSSACEALVGLFGLAGCSLQFGEMYAEAGDHREPGAQVRLRSGELLLELEPGRRHPLSASDRAVLEALASGMATALAYHQLQATAAQARLALEVDRTRSAFLAAVSHNLKTPLAAIKTAVSALLEPGSGLGAGDRVELLETIHDEGNHLERLVTKVLDLTRIRAGALQLDLQTVDVADLASAAVRRLRPLTHQHRLRLDLPEDLPEISLDVTMIEQALLNLLENALRYAPVARRSWSPSARRARTWRHASLITDAACRPSSASASSRSSSAGRARASRAGRASVSRSSMRSSAPMGGVSGARRHWAAVRRSRSGCRWTPLGVPYRIAP
jgi:two-component system sensor histidine kinase KdpD